MIIHYCDRCMAETKDLILVSGRSEVNKNIVPFCWELCLDCYRDLKGRWGKEFSRNERKASSKEMEKEVCGT